MEEPKREDARIRRTYRLLLGALTELLAEKPFDDIRVTDLCERADIHRSTFYDHFEDKFHLLTFGIRELMDLFVPLSPTTSQEDYQQVMHRIFKYFLKNRQMYTLLFLDIRNASAKALFRENYIRAYEGLMKESFSSVPREDQLIYSRHFIGGILSVVDWWLETDAQMPPEELAARFVRLISNHLNIFSQEN